MDSPPPHSRAYPPPIHALQVYALEISPGFLKLLRELVAREGLSRTEVLEATNTETNLPVGVRVDLALLIDVYHHGAFVVVVFCVCVCVFFFFFFKLSRPTHRWDRRMRSDGLN
jgi:hypothetical protein